MFNHRQQSITDLEKHHLSFVVTIQLRLNGRVIISVAIIVALCKAEAILWSEISVGKIAKPSAALVQLFLQNFFN